MKRFLLWFVCSYVAIFCCRHAKGELKSAVAWNQFRGPNSAGFVDGKDLPDEFGPGKNELWSVPLAPGHSSPCVVGDSIFLTTFEPETKTLSVLAIVRQNGSVRWKKTVPANEIERGHPSFNPASSTVASDGERVVAYFGSHGLSCFDWHGNLLWDIPMPVTKSYAGNATSPIIAGDKVILYRANHVDHFLLAVDKATGKPIWRVEQEEPFASELACTACPIVAGDKLIIHSARSVQAYQLETGTRIWVAKCATTATSTPVLAGDEVIVAAWNKMGEPALRPKFPSFEELVNQHDKDADQLISRDEFPVLMIFYRPEGNEAPQNGAPLRFRSADANGDGEINSAEWAEQLAGIERFRALYKTHGILAIPVESEGLLSSEQIRVLETVGIPEVPSPIVYRNRIYIVKNGGVLTCIEVSTGRRIGRIRTGGKGTHYASPVISNGKLFSTAGDGTIAVVQLEPKPKVLGLNDMQERAYATPAIADGVLYVRTHSRLHAFGFQKPDPDGADAN